MIEYGILKVETGGQECGQEWQKELDKKVYHSTIILLAPRLTSRKGSGGVIYL